MSDLVPAADAAVVPAPSSVALGDATPDLETLFGYAREAELRVRSLRMTIVERRWNARGEEVTTHEVTLRHPGQARVTTRRTDDPLSSDYDIWISDGERIRTFDAARKRTSDRPVRPPLVAPGGELPKSARTYEPHILLPSGSIVDTFVHPHGLFRNVLLTGPLSVLGSTDVNGREAILVRSEHPRSTKVLTDRPDRLIDVGIDRGTGFLVQLRETIGDVPTQLAELTLLDVDGDIPDRVFELHVSSDVRELY